MALIALLTFFNLEYLKRAEFPPQEVDSILFQGNRFYGDLEGTWVCIGILVMLICRIL